jgi:uncharacterized delta-60 repeat protein
MGERASRRAIALTTITATVSLLALTAVAGASMAVPGKVDTTFGEAGTALVGFDSVESGRTMDVALGLTLQPDGKMVVVGRKETASANLLAIARLEQDGSLDSTFGSSGKVEPGAAAAFVPGVALQSDKIVVATSGRDQLGLLRLRENGARDGSFGDQTLGVGGALVDLSQLKRDLARTMVLQADGKILVAGFGCPASLRCGFGEDPADVFFVARFTAEGARDSSFGSSGVVTTNFSTSEFERAFAMAVQPDGKIVVAGAGSFDSSVKIALARYRTNGSLDTTFDGDGKVVTDFSTSVLEQATGVAIQPDGKILVTGVANMGSSSSPRWRIALARYKANGALDTTFDDDGKALIGLGPRQFIAENLVALSNGQIIVVGNAQLGSLPEQLFLARLMPDGSPDPTFDGDGRVFRTGPRSAGLRVAVQPNGRIVAIGSQDVPGAATDFLVTRYYSR